MEKSMGWESEALNSSPEFDIFFSCALWFDSVLLPFFPIALVLHLGRICPPGDAWQCLETVLIITTRGDGAIGISWVEVKDAS